MYFFVPETVYFPETQQTEVIFDKSSLRVYEIILPEPSKTYSQRLRSSKDASPTPHSGAQHSSPSP